MRDSSLHSDLDLSLPGLVLATCCNIEMPFHSQPKKLLFKEVVLQHHRNKTKKQDFLSLLLRPATDMKSTKGDSAEEEEAIMKFEKTGRSQGITCRQRLPGSLVNKRGDEKKGYVRGP